ncbi:hypothetical protein SLEP1_g30950 [Rubroshorea leprosula]|uniref:26S proteasome non-ATPase regulatory subunit 3 n=1 Tax=Rubroshorea leprosula TaxID=152421 RepID=A0AAV5K1W6_9ROSI|nr:hypothetical protein SLEP1_g30950 [Rubroshorea leprosula]
MDPGAYASEIRRIVRAVGLTMAIRRKLKAPVLSAFLNFALAPGSAAHSRLSSYLPKEDEHDMEVDTATSSLQAPAKHPLPELEIYCYLLVLIFLIDQKKYNDAKACSSASIARLKNVNRRTLDVLAARLYFYYSLSYELTGDLAEIRGDLLALHRIATLRYDELGQETLLNLLLRNYLHYNLYDQAEKLRSKAPRFEAHSNQQATLYYPYLFVFNGAIDAILDHANGWMLSKETGDIYSTNEPQIAFNSRIAFCLNMHNEAVRALRFPPNSHKEKESAEKRRERQQQEQELAKHIAEEDDDEF